MAPTGAEPEILASFLCSHLFRDVQPQRHTENLNPNPAGEQLRQSRLALSPERPTGRGGVFLGVLPDSHRPDQMTDLPAPLVKIILCKGFANRKSSGLLTGVFVLCFVSITFAKRLPHSIPGAERDPDLSCFPCPFVRLMANTAG